jgi:hypothetical protein
MIRIVSDKDEETDSVCSLKYFDKSVVRAIILGPECSDEQVMTVKEYLDKNEYNIKVGKSRAYELLNSDKLLFQPTAPKGQGAIK